MSTYSVNGTRTRGYHFKKNETERLPLLPLFFYQNKFKNASKIKPKKVFMKAPEENTRAFLYSWSGNLK